MDVQIGSTLSLTSALDGKDGQRHAPAGLPPGKDPVTIVQVAGWAPGTVWTGSENLAPTRFRSQDRPHRTEWLYRLINPGTFVGGTFTRDLNNSLRL
jgi:hypothetical protein